MSGWTYLVRSGEGICKDVATARDVLDLKDVRFHLPPSKMEFETVRNGNGYKLVLAPDVGSKENLYLAQLESPSGGRKPKRNLRAPATGAECGIGGVQRVGGVVFCATCQSLGVVMSLGRSRRLPFSLVPATKNGGVTSSWLKRVPPGLAVALPGGFKGGKGMSQGHEGSLVTGKA